MRAAVLQAVGDREVSVRDDVVPNALGVADVRVAVRAAGICHSDLSAMDGTIRQRVPAVLGHEGAGEVVEVGGAVRNLRPGDRVVVAWVPPCGACASCLRGQPFLCTVHATRGFVGPKYRIGQEDGYALLGSGTWAEEVVVPQEGAVRVDPATPFEIAALVGCAVVTGVGAVLNTARVEPGATVAVIGCGGVGASVVQAARLAGASTIVAVDPVEGKHDIALRFGATAACTPDGLAGTAAQAGIRRGFDYAFEVVGRSETIRAAWEATRRGGTTVVVGLGAATDAVTFSAAELVLDGKRLLSAMYGSADVRRDYGRMLGLWRAGQLDLEGLISRRLTLDEVNDGVDALRGGGVVRQVILFD